MGKKRITETEVAPEAKKAAEATPVANVAKPTTKKHIEIGVLNVESTYNNTKVVLADQKGNVLAWSTSGALGFKGAKKGTPFAAAKIGEVIGDKATQFGIKEVSVSVKGVGSGRESAVRGFISKGINLLSITDMTPVPHNGPKPPKPRRA